MAATFVRAYTWVVAPDEELRLRAEAMATEHDLSLVTAIICSRRASALEP